jgi:hypothetical protein
MDTQEKMILMMMCDRVMVWASREEDGWEFKKNAAKRIVPLLLEHRISFC